MSNRQKIKNEQNIENEALNRENILASSLEKSTESDNLMGGIENATDVSKIEDDPLITDEELGDPSPETGSEEDDTDILSEEESKSGRNSQAGMEVEENA